MPSVDSAISAAPAAPALEAPAGSTSAQRHPPAAHDSPGGPAGPADDGAPAIDRRRALVGLIVGQVALHAAMAGQRMATPLQALDGGHGAWMVGVLLGLFAAVPVLTALPAGRMVDRHGYIRPQRLAVWLTMAGAGLALLACGVAPLSAGRLPFAVQAGLMLGLQCLGAGLAGVGAHLGLIAIQRTAGQLSQDPTERLRIFSWLGIAPSLANAIGPVLAGLAIDHGGYAVAYGLMCALPLVSLAAARAVPLAVTRPVPPPPAAPGEEAGTGGRWARAMELLRLPGMAPLMVTNWLLSSSWDVHAFAVPVLGHARGFSAATIGFVLGLFTVAITLVRLVVPLVAHRVSEAGVLTAAMLGVAAVCAVYPLAPTAWAMGLCALLYGLALGAVQPMVMSALHLLVPAHRQGESLALRSMAINLSSALLPLLFGLVGNSLGPGVLFWAMGAALALGSLQARRLAAVLRHRPIHG